MLKCEFADPLGFFTFMMLRKHVPPPTGHLSIWGAGIAWKLRFLVDGGKASVHWRENSRSFGVIMVGARQITTSASLAPVSEVDPNLLGFAKIAS